jgi:thiamine biosynthesis lipoprotein
MSAAVVGLPGLGTHRQVEHVMGMPISVALRGRHATSTAGRAAWREVIDELRRVDRIFSTYREDSVISRLNRGEVTVEECPQEVAEVLALGGDAEQQSDGAFSVTLPDSSGRLRLDPSGVVKGWATERASRFLTVLDDTDVCLSAGGDMLCHLADPGRPAWRVGIENPLDPSSLVAVVPVGTGAVATSSTRHRGEHLLDARTGRPAQGVASVTVIDRSLTWADIDATAAYAQGPHAADWLRGRGRTALVVWPDATTTIVDGRATTRPPAPTNLKQQPLNGRF